MIRDKRKKTRPPITWDDLLAEKTSLVGKQLSWGDSDDYKRGFIEGVEEEGNLIRFRIKHIRKLLRIRPILGCDWSPADRGKTQTVEISREDTTILKVPDWNQPYHIILRKGEKNISPMAIFSN